MAAGRPPLGDDGPIDRITYLPIDRSRAAERVYADADPRGGRPIGGMRVGREPTVWVGEDEIPALTAEAVAAACDSVVAGQRVWPALVTLARARIGDMKALLAASVSEEVRVRWERLWVISPFLARLSRSDEATEPLVALLCEDLGAVHLMSKFAEQNNASVKRIFARLHDPLLTRLLARLHAEGDDPRRSGLISSIIATMEVRESALRPLLPPKLSELARSSLLDMLYLRPPTAPRKTLRSGAIRERLDRLRR